MQPQLGFSPPKSGEHSHRGDLPVTQAQSLAAIDLTEGKLDDVAPEVTQSGHDFLTGFSIDLSECGESLLVAG